LSEGLSDGLSLICEIELPIMVAPEIPTIIHLIISTHFGVIIKDNQKITIAIAEIDSKIPIILVKGK
jgi:hypothetical protein